MQTLQTSRAVSQILSEIILLAIAIISISVIYTQVLGTPGPQETTNVTIIGKMEDGHPVFDLQRGESLEQNTKIYITIAGGYNKSIYTLDQFFIQNYIEDHLWNIGEQIILPPGNIPSYKGPQVEGTIVDAKTNSIVFWGILQEGLITSHKGGIWHFNEPFWNGTIDEVKDSSGNNNHGVARDEANIITVNTINGNAGNFTGFIDDDVLVKTAWALNITDEITLEAWMRPQNPKSFVDTTELPLKFGFTPYISHLKNEVYVLVSEDTETGKGGSIQTVSITPEGDLDNISRIAFGSSTSSKNFRPMLTKISENIFLVSFIDKDLMIHLQTYNISSNGMFINYTGYSAILNESLNNVPNRPSVQKISETVYAIAYWVKTGPGIIKTLTISSTGELFYTGNMMKYDSTNGYEPCFIHISGDTYAIAYRNAANQGIIKTFTISSDGTFGSILDTIIFDNVSAYEPCLINVSGSMYTVVYRNSSRDYGYAKTFNISSNGVIGNILDTQVFESIDSCYDPCIIHHNSEDAFVIAYSTGNSGTPPGYVISIHIAKNGIITLDSGSRLRFYNKCFNPIVIHISEHVLAICFEGFGAHPGTLITLKYGQETFPPYKGITKLDSYGMYANVSGIAVGSINDVMIRVTGIPNIVTEWHHFTLTYDGINITLYVHDINGNLLGKNSITYLHHTINETTSDLFFGRYYSGFIDEVAIYDHALTETQIKNHIINPGTFLWYMFH